MDSHFAVPDRLWLRRRQDFGVSEKLGREFDPFHTAQIFGGGFIFLGILALFAAIVQHLRIEKRLQKRGYPRVEPWPLGLLTAILLLLIGVYAFVVVLANP